MPRRKPADGQLSLLDDELPEDPAGLFSRATPAARKPAPAAVEPAKPAKPAQPAAPR